MCKIFQLYYCDCLNKWVKKKEKSLRMIKHWSRHVWLTRLIKRWKIHIIKRKKDFWYKLANSFIPVASGDWNSLPLSVFTTTYNLQSFKTHIYRYLLLRPNPWNLSYFHDTGVLRRLQKLNLFFVQLLLVSIIL